MADVIMVGQVAGEQSRSAFNKSQPLSTDQADLADMSMALRNISAVIFTAGFGAVFSDLFAAKAIMRKSEFDNQRVILHSVKVTFCYADAYNHLSYR